MLVRIFFGALLAGVLGFFWGFTFWAVLGAGDLLMDPLPNEDGVIQALHNAGLPSGMYVYPAPAHMNDAEAVAAFEEKHMKGPLLQLAYRANGGPAMPPEQYVKGVAHYFAIAFIAGVLLAMARNALPTYGSRVLFVVLLGLVSTVWSHWADAVWFFDSWDYTAGRGVESLVTALLFGLVLAAIIKPAPEAVSGQ
jgi:hypothetical protein